MDYKGNGNWESYNTKIETEMTICALQMVVEKKGGEQTAETRFEKFTHYCKEAAEESVLKKKSFSVCCIELNLCPNCLYYTLQFSVCLNCACLNLFHCVLFWLVSSMVFFLYLCCRCIILVLDLLPQFHSIQFLYYPFLLAKASERGFQSKKRKEKN